MKRDRLHWLGVYMVELCLGLLIAVTLALAIYAH